MHFAWNFNGLIEIESCGALTAFLQLHVTFVDFMTISTILEKESPTVFECISLYGDEIITMRSFYM